MKVRLLCVPLAVAAFAAPAPSFAQGQRVPTPEQRIERLERQLQQMQRQVFPRGAPAATAGFSDEPAATQASVRNLDERLNALERQLADILRQSEENGHRARTVETELARLREEQDRRLTAIESAAREAAAQPAATVPDAQVATPATRPAAKPPAIATRTETGPATLPAADDPAELAYDEGFQLWRAGKFDQAITSLRAFVSAYPKHRRASWASNLAGRALLDKGEPRAAAEALLANYRANPRGERAADSLYYLGQALMQLNQPEQACKAYSELEDVYGATMRAELKRLIGGAKTEARCN